MCVGLQAASSRSDERPIGVFDSGLGGLTVLRALVDLLPHESTLYFGDTGRFPYGPKPADEVLKYSLEIADLLADRGVKMLVVACNSATAVALEALQDRYEIPVDRRGRARRSGPPRRATRTGRVGVIGTVGTIASGAYQQAAAARRHRADAARRARASSSSSRPATSTPTRSTCSPSGCSRRCAPPAIDTLVLGCTHYPLLARTIGDVMGRDVVLVSSADETAFEARHDARRRDRAARRARARARS